MEESRYDREHYKNEGARLAEQGKGWLENASPFTLLGLVIVVGLLMTTGILDSIVGLIAVVAIAVLGYFAFQAWNRQKENKKDRVTAVEGFDEIDGPVDDVPR